MTSDSLWRHPLVAALLGLSMGGAGWMVHQVVDSTSTRAVMQEAVKQNKADIMSSSAEEAARDVATTSQFKQVGEAIVKLTTNQEHITDLIDEVKTNHSDDVKELRQDLNRGRRSSRSNSHD